MHFSVHSSTIYNSQDIAATQTFINRQVGKEDVVRIFNGILFIHKKNEIMPFAPISRDYYTKWSCCSVTKSCLILCDPMNCSMPGFSVYHYLPEFSQAHVHWASDTIQPSHSLLLPSLLALNFFPASGSFPVSQMFASSGQSIGTSALASVLSKNIQDWFPLGLTGLSLLLSKGLSRVFSSTTLWKC